MQTRDEVLESVLEKSPYFEYLCRYVSLIGFKFKDDYDIVSLTGNNETLQFANMLDLTSPKYGIVDIQTVKLIDEKTLDLLIEIDESDLVLYAEKGIPITKMSISSSNGKVQILPQIEKIINRIFMPPKDGQFLVSDRIELIYGGLLGYNEPKIVWSSSKSDLIVLKYEKGYDGYDVFVSSGFTNPGIGKSLLAFNEGPASGYGYELMIFSKPDDTVLCRELINWVKYVDDTGKHIYPGQYLEYQEGAISGTDISGFIIVPPIDLPHLFPVGVGYGTFLLFIGVTAKELNVVKKEDDIYVIADLFFEKGYINYTPVQRDSVV
ncbi:suppressor of fused domain protein [Paenibacillus sp. SYP-B3998]|uniref:Suppressor of fused domain protein n=1 Tax=Paenibacillus sp. SYP-B3998 TaxID=2678564 RepID=A0A6G4A5J5_9BACL|nr:suppressor of fused domain protein [Paenibacillus sp. SYP-B3998]NEW09786.1 suppressor of fused domain protein [Paenibacillus sp. SYP-B3998]